MDCVRRVLNGLRMAATPTIGPQRHSLLCVLALSPPPRCRCSDNGASGKTVLYAAHGSNADFSATSFPGAENYCDRLSSLLLSGVHRSGCPWQPLDCGPIRLPLLKMKVRGDPPDSPTCSSAPLRFGSCWFGHILPKNLAGETPKLCALCLRRRDSPERDPFHSVHAGRHGDVRAVARATGAADPAPPAPAAATGRVCRPPGPSASRSSATRVVNDASPKCAPRRMPRRAHPR